MRLYMRQRESGRIVCKIDIYLYSFENANFYANTLMQKFDLYPYFLKKNKENLFVQRRIISHFDQCLKLQSA